MTLEKKFRTNGGKLASVGLVVSALLGGCANLDRTYHPKNEISNHEYANYGDDLSLASREQKYGFDEFYNDVDAIENQNLSEETKKRMAVGKFGRLYNSTKIDNFSETERREIRINRQRYIDMLKGVDKGTKDMLGSYLNFENPDDLDLLIWTKIDKDLSINLPFL